MSRLVATTYEVTRCARVDTGFGWTDGEVTREVLLLAHVEQCGDDVTVVWTDESRAEMAQLGFDGDEYVGAVEAVEGAFEEEEREACRVSYLAQRQGEAAE